MLVIYIYSYIWNSGFSLDQHPWRRGYRAFSGEQRVLFWLRPQWATGFLELKFANITQQFDFVMHGSH